MEIKDINQNHPSYHVDNFGAVSSGHNVTTQAAWEVLSNGGNAYDATICAALTACASEPVLASLGGGGFLMAYPQNQKPVCLDFFAHSPIQAAHKNIDINKVTVQFTAASQEFYIGPASSATPGVIKGLFEIHKKLGFLPLKDIASIASSIIRKGIPISAIQNHVLELVKPIYLYSEASRNYFASKLNQGDILQTGEIYINDELANIIEILAIEGDRLFYEGEVSDSIIALMQADLHKGSLTKEDLKSYQVYWRKPLEIDLNNTKIHTNPAPALGGYLLKAILLDLSKKLKNQGISKKNKPYYQILSESLQKVLANPKINCETILEADDYSQLKEIYQSIYHSQKGTTHISVIDKSKNIASLTLSNGEGNGLFIRDTGIMLNNMLGETDVNRLAPHQWPVNIRLSSMMAPSILMHENLIYAIGTGGSNRIPSAIAQMIINLVCFSEDIYQATNAPRIHYDNGFFAEQDLLNDILTNNLSFNNFHNNNFYFGGVHTSLVNKKSPSYQSFADQRRS